MTSDHHLTRTDRKELEGYIEDLQDTVRVLQSQINNLVQRTPRRNENGPVKPIGKEPLPTWEEILQTARIRVKRRTTNEG